VARAEVARREVGGDRGGGGVRFLRPKARARQQGDQRVAPPDLDHDGLERLARATARRLERLGAGGCGGGWGLIEIDRCRGPRSGGDHGQGEQGGHGSCTGRERHPVANPWRCWPWLAPFATRDGVSTACCMAGMQGRRWAAPG